MTLTGKTREHAGVEGDWVCVGAFGGPHGVKGGLKLKSFTERPDAVFRFKEMHKGPGGPLIAMKKQGKSKDGFVVTVDGISSPEQAAVLAGQKLYVARDQLGASGKDEFFLADLIGLSVVDPAGAHLGLVNAVENFGSEDLIEVHLDQPVKGLGRYIFIPFRRAFVPVVDIAAGRLELNMTEWLETQVEGTPENDSDGEHP